MDNACQCGCGVFIPAGKSCDSALCTKDAAFVYDAGGDGDDGYLCAVHDKIVMKDSQ